MLSILFISFDIVVGYVWEFDDRSRLTRANNVPELCVIMSAARAYRGMSLVEVSGRLMIVQIDC